MRKLVSFLIFFLAVSANARLITSDEAAAIASEFLNSSMSIQKAGVRVNVRRANAKDASRGNEENQPYYVFNADDNNGFVIISGDDRAKKVLGYSDTGNFDSDNIPPQLSWLLREYEKEINSFQYVGDPSERTFVNRNNSEKTIIEPLISTKWGQGAPFNNLCPEIEGTKTPAGCVPVAIAQIMNYHKWPEKGEGEYSYNHLDGSFRYFDFESCNFKWALMLDDYNEQSKKESVEAVGEMIYACGLALCTQYTLTPGSYSNISFAKRALVENFKYASDAQIIWRNNYRGREWEDIIYNEISLNRPVYIEGQDDKDGVGHAFICDGYDGNGYFHINWGWSGDLNGYFQLSSLSPDEFQTYKSDLLALIKIQKRSGAKCDLSYDLIHQGSFKYKENGEVETGFIANYSVQDFDGFFGLEFVNEETGESIYHVNTSMFIKGVKNTFATIISAAGEGGWAPTDSNNYEFIDHSETYYFEFNIIPGKYKVYPVYTAIKSNDIKQWHRLQSIAGGQEYVNLVIDAGYKFTYSNPGISERPDIEITQIEMYNIEDGEYCDFVYAHEPIGFRFHYKNNSDIPVSDISYSICDEMGNVEHQNNSSFGTIEPNSEGLRSISNIGVDLNPGKHEVKVFDISGKQINKSPFRFNAIKREYNIEVTDIRYCGDYYLGAIWYSSFELTTKNHSDLKYIPNLYLEYSNGNGEKRRITQPYGFEPNAEQKSTVSIEKGFLHGKCKIKVFEPYGKQINTKDAIFYFPTDIISISFEVYGGEIYLGDKLLLKPIIYPDNADNKTLKWTSDNENIANVSEDGVVTGIGVGSVIITATATDGSGVSATCQVTVLPPLATSITVAPETISAVTGTSYDLTATVLPAAAADQQLVWTSSDETIAVVDANGHVEITDVGEVTITVTTTDGSGLMAVCNIVVLSGIDEIFTDNNGRADIYSINGILIKAEATAADIRLLSPGIYIVNDRKVLVR